MYMGHGMHGKALVLILVYAFWSGNGLLIVHEGKESSWLSDSNAF